MPDPIDWTLALPYLIAAFMFGYLLGSIPFGLLLTKIAGIGDVRSIGSGSIGATNVLRTGRKDLAALTLIGDALKGTAAVLVAGQWGPDTAVLAGLGAFVGHLAPVWLRFRGGKGVATYIGILLGLVWPAVLAFAAIWITVAVLTRYSSLAALTASLATPIVLALMEAWQQAELFVLLTILLWIAHRPNISRLLAGSESRIGDKKPRDAPASDSPSDAG